MMPWGLVMMEVIRLRSFPAIPRWVRSRRPACLSNRRNTTRSPALLGMVDTRTSISRPPTRMEIRPSWGTRFSAMSSLAITLIRDTSNGASSRFGCTTSRSTPSTRNRTTRRFSKVSIWISDALILTASVSSALIKRMIGASSSCSIRSSVSGTESARLARSSSSPSPSTICMASLELFS